MFILQAFLTARLCYKEVSCRFFFNVVKPFILLKRILPKAFQPTLHSNTAILFFSRTARNEADAKQFSLHKRGRNDIAIASTLIRGTRQLIKGCQLPVYHIDEHQQQGENFGERLANAIEFVFDNGFLNVLVVGNDCPSLNRSILHAAVNALETRNLVLGPDKRGGVYLIGINKSAFEKKSFIQNPWQTDELYTSLKLSFVQEDIFLLPVLSDANNAHDLVGIYRKLGANNLVKQIIASFIASFDYVFNLFTAACYCYSMCTRALRGPPIATI